MSLLKLIFFSNFLMSLYSIISCKKSEKLLIFLGIVFNQQLRNLLNNFEVVGLSGVEGFWLKAAKNLKSFLVER